MIVDLEEHEARALVSAAGCVMALLGDELNMRVPLPDGYTIFPLESAQLKLYGHAYNHANTYHYQGRRFCRVCRRRRTAISARRRREAATK